MGWDWHPETYRRVRECQKWQINLQNSEIHRNMKSTNKQPKGLHKGLIQCQSKIAPKQNEMIEKSTLLRCSGERQKGIM